MKPSSAKSKGRALQVWVQSRILDLFKGLVSDQDVRSTSSGANGEDVLFSPHARKLFPYSVECKNLAVIGAYNYYEQAKNNAGNHEPLVIMKMNRKKPLAVVDADHFLELIKELSTLRGNKEKD